MTDGPNGAPDRPNHETSTRTRSGAVIRFVLGAILGLAAAGIPQPIMFLMVNPLNGGKSYMHGLAPVVVDGTLLALAILLLMVVIRRRKSPFISGVVAGASLALLLSATCWGLNFLPVGSATH